MNSYTDTAAKTACQSECDKRNKHIVKTHTMRWKPLWEQGKGWHPALRPAVEPEKKEKRRGQNA